MAATFAKCDFGDWMGIAVLTATGVLSITFLGFGTATMAKYLLWRGRNDRLGTP